jgi:hypothetical protein
MLTATMLSGMAVLMARSRHPVWQFKTKGDVMTSAKPSAKPATEPLIPIEQVPAPLPVRGATVMIEAWAYAP